MKDRSFPVLFPWGATGALLGLVLFLARLRWSGVALGLPLDDAWIHCAFASHLARFHQWGLFAGIHSGGESSPLWPFLLSPFEWGGMRQAPRLALILGTLSFLPLPALVGSLASSPQRARVLALVTGLFGPLLFLALSGMETMLALTLSVAALNSLSRGETSTAGLWAGAAAFFRPDAALLFVVLALLGRRKPLLLGLVVAAGALLLLTLLDGRFPPATLAGRRWLMGLPPRVELHSLGRGGLALVLSWVHAVGGDLGLGRVFSAHPSWGLQVFRVVWKVAFLSAVAAGLLVFSPWARKMAARPKVPAPEESAPEEWAPESRAPGEFSGAHALLLWTLAGLLFYALVLPARGHAGRYQPQVYLLLLLLAVEGLGWMWHLRGRRRVLTVAAAVVLATGFLGGSVEISGLWVEAVAHINSVHLRAASEMGDLLPPGCRLAVFDVGAAAYSYDGEMLDLSGLSDPNLTGILPRAGEGAVRGWLWRRGATHLLLPVLRDGAADGLDVRLGLRSADDVRLVEELRWQNHRPGWARSFQFSGNAFPELVLYRLEWAR